MLLVPIIALAACDGSTQRPVDCMLRVDCGRDEMCSNGTCVPLGAFPDAGLRDASEVEDTGVADSGPLDTGPMVPDAGCPNPIQIVGGTLHCTIQEAIDRAAPGDVVRVPGGRFSEGAVISTALTLEGAGPSTILSPATSPVIAISAANVTVRSLAIESGAGLAVDVLQQATIADVELRGISPDGVLVRGTGIATLSNVRISGMGARVEPGGTATLRGTIIENAPETGLLVDDGASVVVEMTSRVTGSAGPGIVVFTADFEMRDSESHENGPVGSDIEDGVWLDAPTRSVIERCTFSNNQGYGIFCSAGVVPTVCTGNVFMGNQLGNTNCTGCN